MKKLIFLVVTIAVMTTCMVACSNSTDLPTFTTEPTEPIVEPEIPVLSEEFIKTALQFIDEYSSAPSQIENLAAEAIQQSSGYKDKLYAYLNHYLPENFGEEIHQFFGYTSEVYSVDVWIHNYTAGGDVGCVSYNGQDAVYNYDHNPILLSAGVLGKKYPDNVKLAEARIAGFVLTQMCQDDVSCCIVTSPEGKKSYDFTFKNEAFKETSREILQDLSKS